MGGAGDGFQPSAEFLSLCWPSGPSHGGPEPVVLLKDSAWIKRATSLYILWLYRGLGTSPTKAGGNILPELQGKCDGGRGASKGPGTQDGTGLPLKCFLLGGL